ncbi:MAG TPA: ABC transporter permease [Candidatus Polarisedimenticolia bacterium]|nr:ABC transporter permease [Candidatus Polarisedimenticolia bacterium]
MTLGESIADGLAEIRAHALRTLLQTLGVVLGVASLVAVLGLVDAGRREAMAFFSEVGGLTKILVVNRPPREATVTARQLASDGLTWQDAQAIRREIPLVARVDPMAGVPLKVRHGDYLREQTVTGATPDFQAVYKFFPARGRFLIDDDLAASARVCVLGESAAREYFGNEDPLGATLFLGDVGFRVVGVMKRKEFYFNEGSDNALEWMNRMTLVPLTALYTRFTGDTQKHLAYINVLVDRIENNGRATEAVKALLHRRHGGVDDFEVWNRQEMLTRADEQGAMYKALFLTTGLVSLLVGGIVIMNIMLASFQERVREVGLRKALGARASDIAIQCLVEALLVTGLGGTAGLALGVGFAKAITALLDRPAVITPFMALAGIGASVATGLVFGLYPAVRAARLAPVEALRYE